MKLANLLRRDPAAPSLRERAAALRSGLSRRDAVLGVAAAAAMPVPAIASSPPIERADLYDRLLTLYAEDCAARRVNVDADLFQAAKLVAHRLWKLASEVTELPPPKTLDGLRVSVLASAIIYEGELCGGGDMSARAAVALIRSTLAITGTELPTSFSGFGDEPGFREREDSLYALPGAVPAWAVAEMKAQNADA